MHNTCHLNPFTRTPLNSIPFALLLVLFTALPGRAEVLVSSVQELVTAVNAANSGGDLTIRIKDGIYPLNGNHLRITADGVSGADEFLNTTQTIIPLSWTGLLL